MINIVAVQTGNYQDRGAEYVRKLFKGIERNITVPWKGVLFTDDPSTAPEGIEVRAAMPGLKGWWHKLELFAPWAFEPGEQVLFSDLDAVVIGNIDDIASYCGKFAICRDFYFPEHYGSCLMSWEAGTCNHIWETWDKNGRPDFDPHGDQRWIESMMPKVDFWQEMFPGQVVSYKAGCKAGPPSRMKICCFHGLPRPHMVDVPWVTQAWNGE